MEFEVLFYSYFNKLLPWNTQPNLSHDEAKSFHRWTYLKILPKKNTLFWKSLKVSSIATKNKVSPLSIGKIRNIDWSRVKVTSNTEFIKEESVILVKKWISSNGEIKFVSQLLKWLLFRFLIKAIILKTHPKLSKFIQNTLFKT